jgi:acylphosphatase
VEAVFEGEEGAVDRMIKWCHEGTDWASVDSVEVTDEEPRGETDFRVR